MHYVHLHYYLVYIFNIFGGLIIIPLFQFQDAFMAGILSRRFFHGWLLFLPLLLQSIKKK